MSTSKGLLRFPKRQDVQPWIDGYRRYHDAMRGVTLPPRGKAGSAANKLRQRVVAAVLHQEKVRAGARMPRGHRATCKLCRFDVSRYVASAAKEPR